MIFSEENEFIQEFFQNNITEIITSQNNNELSPYLSVPMENSEIHTVIWNVEGSSLQLSETICGKDANLDLLDLLKISPSDYGFLMEQSRAKIAFFKKRYIIFPTLLGKQENGEGELEGSPVGRFIFAILDKYGMFMDSFLFGEHYLLKLLIPLGLFGFLIVICSRQ